MTIHIIICPLSLIYLLQGGSLIKISQNIRISITGCRQGFGCILAHANTMSETTAIDQKLPVPCFSMEIAALGSVLTLSNLS